MTFQVIHISFLVSQDIQDLKSSSFRCSLKFSSLSFGISSYSRFKVSSLRCFKFSSLSYGIKFKSLRGSFSVHKIKCSFSNLFRIQSQVFFHWCFGIKPGTSYLKSQDLLNSKSIYQIIQFPPYASC